MLALIFKDFYLQRIYLLISAVSICASVVFALLIKPIPSVGVQENITIISVVLSFILTYIFLANSFLADEKDKVEPIILSLPNTRLEIVLGKFSSIFLFSLFLCFFLFTTEWIISKFIFLNDGFYLKFNSILLAFLVSLLYSSIAVPVFYKFGSNKGQRIFMVLFMIICIGIPNFALALKKNISLASVWHVFVSVPNIFRWITIIGLFVLCIFTANKIYSKKEF